MDIPIPYCGVAPLPGELLTRFNVDPILCGVLLGLATIHVAELRGRMRKLAAAGWLVTAAAFISPLCALSVSLFSARIAQHMLLMLVAAPLLAVSIPRPPVQRSGTRLAFATAWVLIALWSWHMPVPYAATFTSDVVYWCMHLTLFGGATLLWRELLHHPPSATFAALAAGLFTSMQMGLLGALLALAGRPLFAWHTEFTAAWGLSPLQDQQVGGVLMWIPGILLFLWAALRSLHRLRGTIEPMST
jgi:putative membrane protein